MAHTYEELRKMTVAQLREVAKGVEDDSVRGYTTMHKHELLPALCKVFGLETYEHHEVVGIDRAKIKAQIQALKAKRDAALEAGDQEQLREARHRIKRLKRKMRRAMV